jgi:hypothetical protein
MQISYLWCSKLGLTAALVLACSPAWADGRIVKWVDEKGVTHYGDSVPVQYSGRDNSELNRQGRVVKRNKAGNSQANKAVVEEAKASVEQQRHDSALLATYTTEQEFDLARDRNLQMDEAAVQGLNQRMGSAKDRLAATKKIADGFNQRKKPVPPYVTQDLKENQNEIAKIETQIAEKQQSMDATRQRFEKDKQRFIELKRDPNAPPPVAAPVSAAAPAPSPAPEAAKPAPSAEKPVPAVAAPAPKPVPAATPKAVVEKPAR